VHISLGRQATSPVLCCLSVLDPGARELRRCTSALCRGHLFACCQACRTAYRHSRGTSLIGKTPHFLSLSSQKQVFYAARVDVETTAQMLGGGALVWMMCGGSLARDPCAHAIVFCTWQRSAVVQAVRALIDCMCHQKKSPQSLHFTSAQLNLTFTSPLVTNHSCLQHEADDDGWRAGRGQVGVSSACSRG
jgi:hypothetical protein